ncbi:replication initiation protein [Paraburkholderia sp. Ac-20340]|uniref:RepB family plasmid replication initiator protein n=1 Tax=Paraburkholderia sp. Ac-20340 TaxID=2703888 RepID=UPI001982363F|nr:replication initiation protein [Paraburkholderia sp. Ac-20340]
MEHDYTVTMSNQLARSNQGLERLSEIRVVHACIGRFNAYPSPEGREWDVRLSASEYASIFDVTIDTAYLQLKDVACCLADRRATLSDGQKLRWVDSVKYRDGAGEIELRWSPEIIPHISQVDALLAAVREDEVELPAMTVEEETPTELPASSWNYRVMEFHPPDEERYRAIHEVHYRNGVPTSYSEDPATIGWSVNEGDQAALTALQRMSEALSKPVLFEEDFGSLSDDSFTLYVFRGENGKWFGKFIDSARQETGAIKVGFDCPDDVEAYARENGIYADCVEIEADRR